MSDLISRQAAIDACIRVREHRAYDEIEEIKGLPSAQPERKKGKWIKNPEYIGDDISGFIDNHFSCSECKKEAEINSWGFYILSDFCPHCGADMKEGEKSEIN